MFLNMSTFRNYNEHTPEQKVPKENGGGGKGYAVVRNTRYNIYLLTPSGTRSSFSTAVSSDICGAALC